MFAAFRICLVTAMVLQCCAANRSPVSVVPGWVQSIPIEKGKLYAIGAVGPTLFAEDALVAAADEARKELAKSLQGRVVSILLVVESSEGRAMADEAFAAAATSWATDVVLNKSQIVATWRDLNGIVPGGATGYTYALAVLQLKEELISPDSELGQTVGGEKLPEVQERLSTAKR